MVAAFAMAVGLLHDWLNGAAIAEGRRDALELMGIVSVIFVLVAIVAAFVVSLRSIWTSVAIRIAGSWVAASGLLVLALRLRGI
jgi:urease accessory protein